MAQPRSRRFYRGKTITIVIGYSAGGGYDIFARLLAHHLGRHVPGNPAVVPQNMPGAGSRKAGMYLYNVAPKDGTTIGTIGRNEPIAPLIEDDAGFDGTQVHLDRQRRQRQQHLPLVAHVAGQDLAGFADHVS